MAAITERGPFQFQATIRRKGYKSQTRTFETRADAEAWAKDIEAKMHRGHFLDDRLARTTTLDACLARYASEVTPEKKGAAQETSKITLIRRHPIAKPRPSVSLRMSRLFMAARSQRSPWLGRFLGWRALSVLQAAACADCWRDNVFVERLWRSVKYEEVYLKAYDSVAHAKASLGTYFLRYNTCRPHSSLDGRTPETIYYAGLAPLEAAA